MSCREVEATTVIESWYRHEIEKPNAGPWLRAELPRRAGNPRTWRLCELAAAEALALVVGPGWNGWTDWAAPEGTYERVARALAAGVVPAERADRIRALSDGIVGASADPLFAADPLILQRVPGWRAPTVIEGHHRAAAISLATITGRDVGPWLAYLAE